ncbi:ANTAR domain-containing protein [Cellulomonas hominis]|uniref:ANTAR domain-containing protein n=1 Tax=Cellulomonas hominis TaxID=156981 RepID=UPI0014443E53|nr:ANTAR domain-containing protein [Cellulomonas hominis]NKY08965.1 ANTAR domain-containing protein [Cellulomonas hominis]
MGIRGVETWGPTGVAPAMRVLRRDVQRDIGRNAEICATAVVRGEHRWLAGVPDLDPGDHVAAWSSRSGQPSGFQTAVWRRSGDVLVCVSARASALVDWAAAREDLEASAAIVTAMVADQQALVDMSQTVEDLTVALRNRSVIDQAIGVVMAQNRCGSREAFGILRAASQHRNEKLRDVAAGIVQRMSGAPVDPGGFCARPAARPEVSGRP